MSNRIKEEGQGLSIGPAIRQLRQGSGLTQVEFAQALGLAPASIYRYEAGTTKPSPKTLVTLRNFAAEHENRAAEHMFNRALHIHAGISNLELPLMPTDQVFEVLEAHASGLSLEDLSLVLAFIHLLADRASGNQSVYNALRALLAPYIGQAEKNLKGLLKKKP
jgi:transcriptional regulator with XRE-family HTH domain